METTTYTSGDVERATKLADELRQSAADQRDAAVDVDHVLLQVRKIALGAREWSYAPGARVPRPTPEGIKHVALLTDALRAREHALTRLAGVLDATAIWLEAAAKFNAPSPAVEVPVATLDTVASEG